MLIAKEAVAGVNPVSLVEDRFPSFFVYISTHSPVGCPSGKDLARSGAFRLPL